jgi:hypothetical protein
MVTQRQRWKYPNVFLYIPGILSLFLDFTVCLYFQMAKVSKGWTLVKMSFRRINGLTLHILQCPNCYLYCECLSANDLLACYGEC